MQSDFIDLKAIVFDTFGTLVDWRASIVAELEAFGRERGIDAEWAGFTDAWRGAYRPNMNRVRTGELPWTKLDDLHAMELEALLDRFGVTGLDAQAKRRLNRVWHRLDPWPDTVPALTRLRERFVLAPLSNGNVALLTNLAKRAGIPFDLILSAELARHYKPDPQTYRMPCELLDLAPHQVMMVAAHNDDLIAAAKEGLRTGFIPRPSEYGPHQKKDFRAEAEFDVVGEDLEDLATQVLARAR
jgi:2-haloacid dehalogenase